MKDSLKTKLFTIFIVMIALTVTFEVLNLKIIRLPQLYLLEANSDQKDINRIKTAFKSMVKELGVINYDNAVWDDTYDYIDNRDPQFTESNFVIDAFQSIRLNGIYLYDRQGNSVWNRAWNRNDWSSISFAPFDLPTPFVKQHILSSDRLVSENSNRPVIRAGFTMLGEKLVLYAATSIFKANLQGHSNGTMVFWRFADDNVFDELQERSGINFRVEIIKSTNGDNKGLSSKNVFISGSFRDEKGMIFDYYPFSAGAGGMKFIYSAPARQFEVNWLNNSTIITSFLFSLTLLIVILLIHYLIIQPILNAELLVNSIIKDNDRSVRFNSRRKDELGKLFKLIDRLLDDVASQEQELKSHNLRLQEISQTDGLTNIANRRALDEYMAHLLKEENRGVEISILVCDVDYFKKFNDFYGHAIGDKALKIIAESLQGNLHKDTDFVARYGGEEFVIVLKNTNEKQAKSVANNLLKSILKLRIPHQKSSISKFVSLSIGIHAFTVISNMAYEPLFKKADEALYCAKKGGRNSACVSEG